MALASYLGALSVVLSMQVGRSSVLSGLQQLRLSRVCELWFGLSCHECQSSSTLPRILSSRSATAGGPLVKWAHIALRTMTSYVSFSILAGYHEQDSEMANGRIDSNVVVSHKSQSETAIAGCQSLLGKDF